MSERRIPLGPFALDSPFARGGMGQVWAGRHVGQDVAVAVKVLTGPTARRPVYAAAFRNEVRAMAGLEHPGVILVLDYGQIPEETAVASDGALEAGSPYLVMERATAGNLLKNRPRRFMEALAVLRALLDALAHAHAAGVVHRDLKPANVLLTDPDPRLNAALPAVKLTDFGLAHAMGAPQGSGRVAGTPPYMAPEQYQGRWRDFGPWTDLYGLGCLAWELFTGGWPRAPADPAAPVTAWREAHEQGALPAFAPRFPCPLGLEAWLHALLARAPEDRFQRAADAACALDALSAGAPLPCLPAPAPFPTQRKATARYRPATQLLGAGLGLYGLRRVPLVGREREREALWQALAEAQREGAPRVVLLHGTGGSGKTRLASWLCEEAHAQGAATVLRASYSQMGGVSDGLGAMHARHLGCNGLEGEALRARLIALEPLYRETAAAGPLDPWEVEEIAALLEPVAPLLTTPRTPWRLSTPAARLGLLLRLLSREARGRPLLVHADDVQWGAEAIALARLALSEAPPFPLLLLLTAADEALAERPLESRSLGALRALPGARAIHLGPLPPEPHAALVRELLGLEGALSRSVTDRTAGNPLFAVQIVGDWVQRGVLVPGAEGFQLSAEESGLLPDSLHQVWSERVARLLLEQPTEARAALELAALLGQSVVEAEWTTACAAADLSPPDGLLDTLLARRLATRTEEGWRFAHGMLRESVLRGAAESSRWAALNRAAAETLRPRAAAGAPDAIERRARHLLEAGDLAEALPLLHQAAIGRHQRSDYDACLSLLEQRAEALSRAGVPQEDPRWTADAVLRAHVQVLQGRLEEALASAESAVEAARRWGQAQLPDALRALGLVWRARGDIAAGEALSHEALAAYRARSDLDGVRACLRGLAYAAQRARRFDLAEARYREGLALGSSAEDPAHEANCLLGLAYVAQFRGEPAEASARYEAALHHFEALGHRVGVAECWNGLAEAARTTGDLGRAAQGYRRAERLYAAVGSGEVFLPLVNLGLVLLAAGRPLEARPPLEQARRLLERQGRRDFLGCATAVLIACHAAEQDWARFEQDLAEAAALLGETGFVDADVAWPLSRAAAQAAACGQSSLATAAWNLAIAQWEALDRPVEVAEAEAGIAALQARLSG